MAIYEFKNRKMKDEFIIKSHIQKYLNGIEDYSISAYVVYDAPNKYGFSVKRIRCGVEENEHDTYFDFEIYNYEIVQNSFNNGYFIEKNKKLER